MVTFECTCARRDGVTLVTARVAGLSEPTRITVANRLDGPVWPPRHRGRPERGWDDDGFEAVLCAGTHALGYASPATPVDPPAELVDVEPAPAATPTAARTDTPEDVLRELGTPAPPADAVPAAADRSHGRTDNAEPTPSDRRDRTTRALPADVEAWFATLSRRVDRAEALADADSLDEATAAVRDAGGLAGVREVADRAAADERALRTLAARAERLARRRADATVPAETLARLA